MQLTLLYDTAKEKNVDFLIKNQFSGKIIPVEVGFNKEGGQLKEAIERFKAPHGILVTNTEKTIFEDNIFKLPISTFII